MEISEEELVRIQEKVEKLKQSKFKQQMLPAWRPVPSFGSTMVIFGIFGFIFLSLGITLYVMSDKIQSSTTPYDGCSTVNLPPFEGANPNVCDIPITIDAPITGPVYVYYQLENFYQNHRRYVKSRSNEQLLGKDIQDDTTEKDNCAPITTNKEMKKLVSVNNTTLNEDDVAFPCGLVAMSYFNDSMSLYRSPIDEADLTVGNITIADDDIAWESDVQYKFFNLPEDWQAKQWTNIENQHFIVWMRTAGLPNFRKLYGVINEDLEVGTYYLRVENNYDVSSFDGHKYFVISTTNLLGGQNYFLAICYIIVGGLCLMFGIIFFIAYMTRKNAARATVSRRTN